MVLRTNSGRTSQQPLIWESMKLFLISLLLIPLLGLSQLQPAKIFSDNMVIQRDKPVHFWGKCIPGKKVEVIFAGLKRSPTVNTDSTWSVYFPKQIANANPQSIIISSGSKKIQYNNILIGDIWVCSGQSNMEWTTQKEMQRRFLNEL